MKKGILYIIFSINILSLPAQVKRDSIYTINEVVVTGTRNETDIRHLPMSISVVDNEQITDTINPYSLY